MALHRNTWAVLLIALCVAQPFTALAQNGNGNGNSGNGNGNNNSGNNNGNSNSGNNNGNSNGGNNNGNSNGGNNNGNNNGGNSNGNGNGGNGNGNGNSGNGNGNNNGGNNNGNGNSGNNNGNGNGRGDPLIQSFEGALFFFHGEPDKFYNLASITDAFQVSTQLKEANNAVHIGSSKNGTYMRSIGFLEEGARVEVETFADDSARMIVKVNNETVPLDELTSERTLELESGASLNVVFKTYQTNDGTVLYITSPHISVGVSLVPPGLDHAGYWQPSYLNVNLTLLAAPQGTLQGVIGDTFHWHSDSLTAATADTPEKALPTANYSDMVYPVFPDMTYELPSLFDAPRFSFPSSFIHEVIQQRKAVAARLTALAIVPGSMMA